MSFLPPLKIRYMFCALMPTFPKGKSMTRLLTSLLHSSARANSHSVSRAIGICHSPSRPRPDTNMSRTGRGFHFTLSVSRGYPESAAVSWYLVLDTFSSYPLLLHCLRGGGATLKRLLAFVERLQTTYL